MAEPIEVLFGVWTRLIPRNHVLDGGPDPPCTGTILRGGKWRLLIGSFHPPLQKRNFGVIYYCCHYACTQILH